MLDTDIEAGVVRSDIRKKSVSGLVLEMISFNAFSSAIAGETGKRDRDEAAEELWQLLIVGIGVPA